MIKDKLKDVNYKPSLSLAIPLGIQHVLAMFSGNITPAIIIAGVAGFSFGSTEAVYMVQMAMLFAGIATLMQTISIGPIGAKLPIMQGTSFAFVPIMIPFIASGNPMTGLAAIFGASFVGGIFQASLGTVIGKIRPFLPSLITGLIVLAIGISLLPVGIKYAAGGAAPFQMNADSFGSLAHWSLAGVVVIVSLGLTFFGKGFWSVSAVLIGILCSYLIAIPMGFVSFSGVEKASWFALPELFKYGMSFNPTVIVAMILMCFVSAIETVGDISGITKAGSNREPTSKELAGGTFADGIGSSIAALFGGLPNTSFSQNVGLISLTGMMSRYVVMIGGIFLIVCGVIPKIGAVVLSIPAPVLGGALIVMFGMIASAGLNILSSVNWNQRNMVIFAISVAVGIGLPLVPTAIQHLHGDIQILLKTGLLPLAVVAIVLNIVIPQSKNT